MSFSMLKSRKGQHPIMALVIGAVVIFVGIYVVMQVIGSIGALPSRNIAESLVLVNATAKAVSYPTIGVLNSVYNSSDTLPQDTSQSPVGCAQTDTTVTCNFNASYAAGTWSVDYDYIGQTGNTTYGTTQTTFWNAMQLGAVSLITLAASLVLGSFFFQ